jgi:hypothetical protein
MSLLLTILRVSLTRVIYERGKEKAKAAVLPMSTNALRIPVVDLVSYIVRIFYLV